ncbi:MAG: hypothetical protein AABY74_03105 [Planctomycetota bacterium]
MAFARLTNTDNASVSLRKHLLENGNLHTVLDLPGGTFSGCYLYIVWNFHLEIPNTCPFETIML